MVLSRNH